MSVVVYKVHAYSLAAMSTSLAHDEVADLRLMRQYIRTQRIEYTIMDLIVNLRFVSIIPIHILYPQSTYRYKTQVDYMVSNELATDARKHPLGKAFG